MPTEADGILVASVRANDAAEIGAQLDRLESACRALDLDGVLGVIRTLVPEYSGTPGKAILPA